MLLRTSFQIAFLICFGICTLGATAQNPEPSFDDYKAEMMPRVGEQITVVGVLQSAKLGWLVDFNKWGIYVYGTQGAEIPKMNELSRFHQHRVQVTGTLRYYSPPPPPPGLIVAIPPEHFYFDVANVRVIDLSPPALSQTIKAVEGRWVWKEPRRRNKRQTQFTILIRREGDVVRGTYSVDEFINGRWQGEDGNQTAFLGRVDGKAILIEFDPMATAPGYEQNVTYHAPTDGRQPGIASITANGRTLLWKLLKGSRLSGVPMEIRLIREPRPR